MALGLLGGYNSHSDISDSDDENPQPTPLTRLTNGAENARQEGLPSDDETRPSEAQGTASQLSLFTAEGRDNDDGSTSSSSEDKEVVIHSTRIAQSPNLPLPDLDTKQHMTESAFRNPYKEAEEARLAVLKQHVGDFAKEVERPRGRRPWGSRNQSHPEGTGDGCGQGSWSPEREKQGGSKRKHRSGVLDSLVPPHKALKLHQQIQAKERPWTMRL